MEDTLIALDLQKFRPLNTIPIVTFKQSPLSRGRGSGKTWISHLQSLSSGTEHFTWPQFFIYIYFANILFQILDLYSWVAWPEFFSLVLSLPGLDMKLYSFTSQMSWGWVLFYGSICTKLEFYIYISLVLGRALETFESYFSRKFSCMSFTDILHS